MPLLNQPPKHSFNFLNKRYASLLEVVIAMSLTSIILTTLFFFYQQVIMIGAEIDKTKVEAFHLRFMEKRLADVLTNIYSDNPKEPAVFSIDNSIGMQGSQSLIFTFDNGNCLLKEYSYIILGRLMLDSEGNFLLFTFPLPKKNSGEIKVNNVKKQLLMKGVSALKFEFFIPVNSKKSSTNTKTQDHSDISNQNGTKPEEVATKSLLEPEPKGKWRKENWLKEYKSLPLMIKVILKMSKDQPDIIFIFELNNADAHIVYE